MSALPVEELADYIRPAGYYNIKATRLQNFFAPFVEKVYGARFDRNTLENLKESSKLKITNTYFLKRDIYQVIEGYRSE